MITIFTDGSCVQGNPGMAGGAYVIVKDGKVVESLGVPIGRATNNAGELIAALCGLKAALTHVEDSEELVLVSDSRYVLSSVFKTSDLSKNANRPNVSVLKELGKVVNNIHDKGCRLHTRWVKGHDRNSGNKMCDKLARASARSQKYQQIRGE